MAGLAGSLITAFDFAWDRLTGRLEGLTDEEYFWEPMAGCWSLREGSGEWEAPFGPSWGPYPESNTVDRVLHVLDEVVHHGAEVGLLRDLYVHRSELQG